VNHGNVTRHVRVRVLLARAPVRRPPRMTNTNGSLKWLALERPLKLLQFSCGSDHLNVAVFVYGNTCRVVTTVFQTPEPFEKNRRHSRGTHIPNNSTHTPLHYCGDEWAPVLFVLPFAESAIFL